jgi:methylated-DNA-[protein]-cysteine S-methyltransferase
MRAARQRSHPSTFRKEFSAVISPEYSRRQHADGTLGDRLMRLLTDHIPSILGTLVIVARDERLCVADFEDCRARMAASIESRYGAVELERTADPFGMSTRLLAYFAGDLRAIDTLVVETGGTPFQQEVWAALRGVPPGNTVTYAELARTVGRPAAIRAVGTINGRNPLAIVVPCHRVVGSDGSLTGYAGGLWRKRWLLTHEGALASSTVTHDSRIA